MVRGVSYKLLFIVYYRMRGFGHPCQCVLTLLCPLQNWCENLYCSYYLSRRREQHLNFCCVNSEFKYNGHLSHRAWLVDRKRAAGVPVFDIGVHRLVRRVFLSTMRSFPSRASLILLLLRKPQIPRHSWHSSSLWNDSRYSLFVLCPWSAYLYRDHPWKRNSICWIFMEYEYTYSERLGWWIRQGTRSAWRNFYCLEPLSKSSNAHLELYSP